MKAQCAAQLSAVGLLLAAPSMAASAGAAAESDSEQPARHVLYLGLDVGMQVEDTMTPVVNADDVSVDVELNGARRRFPLRLGGQFRASVVPRVGKSEVRIDDLREEKGFSRGNDPHRQAAAQELILTTAQSAREDLAARAMRVEIEKADAQNIGHGKTLRAAYGTEWNVYTSWNNGDDTANAMRAYDIALGTRIDSSQNSGDGQRTHNDEQIYDALGISFKVSSPVAVEHAYGIIRTFYRSPEKPEEQLSSVRFFGLPDLGPKPIKIYFHNEGLPRGFTLDNYAIHIYTNGRELATNLSKNRVELTLDEIHQFLVLKYGTENSGGNAPVGIATELLENELRAIVPPDQLNRAVDVVVNEQGRATKVTLEDTGWSSADAYLTNVLLETRYLPALRSHKPVTDTGRFVLSEFLP